MQFQVPQFIEVEDRIFGPFTFKQFIYLAGGAGACYLLYRILPLVIAVPLIAAVGGFAASLAFIQFNGRPFISSVENAFFFFLHPRLYLWNNAKKPKAKIQHTSVATEDSYIPRLSDSRLHELAWSLDIKERVAANTEAEDRPHAVDRKDIMALTHTARDIQLGDR